MTEIGRGRGNNITNQIPEGMFTAAQIGKMVNRSRDTINRWWRLGHLHQARMWQAGEVSFPLFDARGVKKARQLAAQRTRLVNRGSGADKAA